MWYIILKISMSVKQENTNAENLGNVKILQDRTSACVAPASKDQNVYKVINAVALCINYTYFHSPFNPYLFCM